MELPEIKVNHIETKSVMTKSNGPLGGSFMKRFTGHPTIVDYFYHEEVRGTKNSGKRNK